MDDRDVTFKASHEVARSMTFLSSDIYIYTIKGLTHFVSLMVTVDVINIKSLISYDLLLLSIFLIYFGLIRVAE